MSISNVNSYLPFQNITPMENGTRHLIKMSNRHHQRHHKTSFLLALLVRYTYGHGSLIPAVISNHRTINAATVLLPLYTYYLPTIVTSSPLASFPAAVGLIGTAATGLDLDGSIGNNDDENNTKMGGTIYDRVLNWLQSKYSHNCGSTSGEEKGDRVQQEQCQNDEILDVTNGSDDDTKNGKEDEGTIFDLFSGWTNEKITPEQLERQKDESIADFFNMFITGRKTEKSPSSKEDEKSTNANSMSFAKDLFDTFVSMLNENKQSSGGSAAMKIVEEAQNFVIGMNNDTRTFRQTVNLLKESWINVKAAMDKSFGSLFSEQYLPPSLSSSSSLFRNPLLSLFYYLDHDESVKNPSWKRRTHRFFPSYDLRSLPALAELLYLAELAYFSSPAAIAEGLEGTGSTSSSNSDGGSNDQWVLVYAKTSASPNEPSHYVAIKKEQTRWFDSRLQVLISVRGTKELEDILTDALHDAVPYPTSTPDEDDDGNNEKTTGMAHAGIVQSGKWLVSTHIDLLKHLLSVSQKRKIQLSLVGHSLGAGVATIAAMEFNTYYGDLIDATAVGFGCPALLSRDLSDKVKPYVTTIVADTDVVPRMSGATIANKIMDVMEYDWTTRAQEDVRQLVSFLKRTVAGSWLWGSADGTSPLDAGAAFMETFLEGMRRKEGGVFGGGVRAERKEVVLVPPGECVHFYRDGSGGVSARYTPCDFFDEIDVSLTMVDDHLTPTGYYRLLLEAMRGYHADYNYRFRHDSIWRLFM